MANYAEALSAPRPKRGAKKELSHIEVREAENGGHLVTHHFEGFQHSPEEHVFGEGEGREMLAHVGKHMGVEIPHNVADGTEEEE